MRRFQKGFGLVEIMVGLVVGMISMLVVLQVFQNAEARKRTTTSGADAQASGAIGLYMIERDTKMAGWGMPPQAYAECHNLFTYCDGSEECGGTEGALEGLSFAPLLVTDGGSGPDTIAVQYFADPEHGTFRLPSRAVLRQTMPQPSSELDVNTVSGCAEGDLILLRQAGNCTLANITHVQDIAKAPKLQHNPGAQGIYNPPASFQNSNNWPAYTKGAELSCFKPTGAGPIFSKVYSVDAAARRLERSDNGGSNQLVMADIVDLQAQYGIADAGNQHISSWVDAKDAWLTPGPDAWRRIKAVRVALVARGGQYDRSKDSDGNCTATTSAMAQEWSGWADFDTSSYPADWGCYRYRVFETVIPLRNIIWGNL